MILITSDGNKVIDTVSRYRPDLIILNNAFPEIDGLQLCWYIREISRIPIIVISPYVSSEEKIKYLNLGADEYITQPIKTNEFIAQIKAVLRRSKTVDTVPTQSSFVGGEIEINFDTRRVVVGTKEVRITPTEYNLLQVLVLSAGKVCTRNHLLERVWGPEYKGEKTYLYTYIKRLRAKLESDPGNPRHIICVPGIGYWFCNKP